MSREKLENWVKLEGFLEKLCGGDNFDDSGNGFGMFWNKWSNPEISGNN